MLEDSEFILSHCYTWLLFNFTAWESKAFDKVSLAGDKMKEHWLLALNPILQELAGLGDWQQAPGAVDPI